MQPTVDFATPEDVHYNIDVEKRGRRWGGEFQVNFRPSDNNELVAGASFMKESVAQSDDYWHDNITGETTRPFYFDPVSVTN